MLNVFSIYGKFCYSPGESRGFFRFQASLLTNMRRLKTALMMVMGMETVLLLIPQVK